MTENTNHRRYYLRQASAAGLDAAEARNRELCAQGWKPDDMAGEIIRAYLDASAGVVASVTPADAPEYCDEDQANGWANGWADGWNACLRAHPAPPSGDARAAAIEEVAQWMERHGRLHFDGAPMYARQIRALASAPPSTDGPLTKEQRAQGFNVGTRNHPGHGD